MNTLSDMVIRNKYGLEIEVGELVEFAEMTAEQARGFSLEDAKQDKMQAAFYERLIAAERRGASEEELNSLHARDVRFTVVDVVIHHLRKVMAFALVMEVVWFLNEEPDCSQYDYMYG
jgi:hypothetical protein